MTSYSITQCLTPVYENFMTTARPMYQSFLAKALPVYQGILNDAKPVYRSVMAKVLPYMMNPSSKTFFILACVTTYMIMASLTTVILSTMTTGKWLPVNANFNLMNPKKLPADLRKAALQSGLNYTRLYRCVYASGKVAWRIRLNGKNYYPKRSLLATRTI